MAKKKARTPQQIKKSKERANLRRRINRAIKNIEKETGQNIFFDVNAFLDNRKKPLTTTQLSELRGPKLAERVKRDALVGLVPKDDGSREYVTFRDYKDLLKQVEKAQKLAQKYHSGSTINPPNAVMTVSGFQNYADFISDASKREYWIAKGNRMIDNFMKSNASLGRDSLGYQLIQKRIKRLGVSRTLEILVQMESDKHHISASYWFDSDQGMIYSKLGNIFDYLGIPFDPNKNYLANADDKKAQESEWVELTDEETEDLPF